MPQDGSPGTLYIIATPIGNLEDVSLRALRILKSVDLIAAEDTRTTSHLLQRYEIRKPLVSYHSYNERRRVPELMAKLRSGTSIALVSDAGTPGISDPAYRIIREALDEGIPVQSIPGPAAFLPALILSGFSPAPFVFEGFLPAKKGRTTMLEQLHREGRTFILYESPHRILRTLADLEKFFGDREVILARELTKKFEEVIRGTIPHVRNVVSLHPIRGEFVIVVRGKEDSDARNLGDG